MKTFLLFFAIIWIGQLNPVDASNLKICPAQAPGNLSATPTTCSFNLSWSPAQGASSYWVRYKRSVDPNWITIKGVTTINYVLTGLVANTTYNIRVLGACDNSNAGEFSSTNQTTLTCAVVNNISSTVTSPTTTTVSWTVEACSLPNATVRYRKVGEPTWLTTTVSVSPAYLLDLIPGSNYEYQVSICATESWSTLQYFSTLGNTITTPNVLIIILDDAKGNSFSFSGGPIETPYMDQIASEGMYLKKHYIAHSLCAPSRAALYTGVYDHNIRDNSSGSIDTSRFPIFLDQLKSVYSDRWFIGKNQAVVDTLLKYYTKSYESVNNQYGWSLNGAKSKKTDYAKNCIVARDKAVEWIQNATGPFFGAVSFRDPHSPFTADDPYQGLYDSLEIIFGPEMARKMVDYPSFLYTLPGQYYISGEELKDTYRNYLEEVKELDDVVGSIYQVLENTGKLDNTILIVMDDNGYMLGEYGYEGKRLGYDASTKTFCVIRYPSLYPAGTVVSSLTENVDIAATILDILNISNSFGHGKSLKNINSVAVRDTLWGGTHYTTENNLQNLPKIQYLVTKDYKYIKYFCTNVTEEFFDLVNDPHELTNLVNDTTYQDLIQEFRQKNLYFAHLYGDTFIETILPCSLITDAPRLESEMICPETDGIVVYPNPTDGQLTIVGAKGESIIFSSDGRYNAVTEASQADVSNWPAGLYFIRTQNSSGPQTVKFMKQ